MYVLVGRAAARGECSAIARQATPVCHATASFGVFLGVRLGSNFRVRIIAILLTIFACSSPIVYGHDQGCSQALLTELFSSGVFDSRRYESNVLVHRNIG